MTEKKLKINYPKRNRAPKPETQLADEEKKAQKAAQSTPRRRHQLQTFDLVTVDPPKEFPAIDNNFELHDPSLPEISPLLDELDFMLADPKFDFSSPDFNGWEFIRRLMRMPNFKGWQYKPGSFDYQRFKGWEYQDHHPDMPNIKGWEYDPKDLDMHRIDIWNVVDDLDLIDINKLGLITPKFFHQFKLRLYDLYDFVNRFDFELGEYPVPIREPEKVEEERKERPEHWRYLDYDRYDNHRKAISHNGIWTDEYLPRDNIELIRAGNICVIRIYLTADENSTVENDYIDTTLDWHMLEGEWVEEPLDPGFTGTPAIIYDVSYESQDYENSFFNSTVRDITHTLRNYEGDTIPYPTKISLSFSNGRLNINETFPYATSATKCNVKRMLTVFLIGDVGEPFYEEFRENEEQPENNA